MKRYKKLLSLILAFVITLQGIIFKPIVSYANTVQTQNVLNDKYLKSPRVAFALPIAASLGSVALGKLMSIFMFGLVSANSLSGGVLNLIHSLISPNKNDKTLMANLEKIVNKAHHVTQAFLVAYGNFSTSTGKIVDSVRTQLLEYYQESFIADIEKALADGVTFEDLKTFGVTNLFTLDNINILAPGGSFARPSINSKYGVTNVGFAHSDRWVQYKHSSGIYYDQSMRIPMANDINMSLVDEVDIIMLPMESYNYGWDASNFVQIYKFKVGEKFYQLRVSIVKSLSPNQRGDRYIDGLGIGFYEVDSLEKIVKDSLANTYFISSSKIDANYIPTFGTNCFTSAKDSPTGVAGIDFGKFRSICADFLGKELFTNMPDDVLFLEGGKADRTWHDGYWYRFTDYSKALEGKYDKDWVPIGGIVNIPDMGGKDVYFPETWNPGNGSPDMTFPYDPGATIPVPNGGVITKPGDMTSNPGISYPDAGILNPPYVGDVPDVDVPDVDVPDVDVPDVDVPDVGVPDAPGIDIPNFPNDIPKFEIPGLDITFNPIDFTPILNIGDTLKEKFPFSLPFDFYKIVNMFLTKSRESAMQRNLERAKYLDEGVEGYAGGVAPIFRVPMPGDNYMYLDFAMFDPIAEVCRLFVAIGYSICLVFILRKVVS